MSHGPATLVYAVGADHPLKTPSAELIAAAGDGRVDATTTAEVIQEFVDVRSRRRSRADAVALARDFTRLLSPLLLVDEALLERGLALFARQGIGAFDAVLAATALASGADVLVSADRAFAAIPRLRHVAPGAPELARLLAL